MSMMSEIAEPFQIKEEPTEEEYDYMSSSSDEEVGLSHQKATEKFNEALAELILVIFSMFNKKNF